MRNSLLRLLGLAALWCCAACRAGAPGGRELPAPQPEPVDLACLGDSLDALREEFNANQDRPRLVTLLSPDCSPCELGSRAVRESVLEAYPGADLKTFVVWVDVGPRSSLEAARRRGASLADPRVSQYHDPDQLAGRAFAERLLPTTLAWDVYLFYPPGVRWEAAPPDPLHWSHQRGRIETRHFHPRERLFAELRRAAGELTAAGERPAGAVAAAGP